MGKIIPFRRSEEYPGVVPESTEDESSRVASYNVFVPFKKSGLIEKIMRIADDTLKRKGAISALGYDIEITSHKSVGRSNVRIEIRGDLSNMPEYRAR